MADGNGRMSTKFWVPIMITTLIAVISITSTFYLSAAKNQVIQDKKSLENRMNMQELGATSRESRLTKLETMLPMLMELTKENNEMLKKHMGIK